MTTYGQQDGHIDLEDDLSEETQPHQRFAFPAQRVYEDRADLAGNDELPFSEARQRERFGGLNWGAGFFGALVAAAVAVILGGVVAAALLLLGLETALANVEQAPGPSLIGVAAIVFGVLVASYYAGGYVAGRMSRFDGGRQGVGVWVIGILMTGLVSGVGLLAGAELGVLRRFDPGGTLDLLESPLVWAAATGATLVLGALVAAVAGGKVGCHYHQKVDDSGYL